MAIDYAFVAVDHSGNEVNQFPALNAKLTRRLSAGCDGQADVMHTQNLTGLIQANGVKIYRNGTLVFFGEITGRTRKQHVLTLKFADPLARLARRSRQSVYSVATPGKKGPAMVSDLIAAENTRDETHLRMGLSALPSTFQTYTVNKSVKVDQAINDLASVAGGYGFWYKINPVDGLGVEWATLDTYLSSGTDRPGCRWEYGDGTLDNILADWAEDEGQPVTNVRVWGQPANGQGYKVGKNDGVATGGIGAYGLSDQEYQFDVPNASAGLLQATAQGYLISSPPLTWTVNPLPNDGTDQRWVPDPWDDFDVGDTGRLTLVDDNYLLRGQTVRVTEFTVEPNNDARAEKVSGLKLEVPLVGTHTRVQPSAANWPYRLLGSFDKRLRQLEHSPQ